MASQRWGERRRTNRTLQILSHRVPGDCRGLYYGHTWPPSASVLFDSSSSSAAFATRSSPRLLPDAACLPRRRLQQVAIQADETKNMFARRELVHCSLESAPARG